MNIKNLIALVAVVFASFIQVGCGTATPTTTGYGQMAPVNGMCQPGYVLMNNMCSLSSGVNPYGNTGYNNGYNTGYGGAGSCQIAAGQYFVQGGFMNGVQVQPGCYTQGPCTTGYAYVQQVGLCVIHN